MNKIRYIVPIFMLLLGMVNDGYAQSSSDKEPRVKILGNVYGGGELAQVAAPTADAAKAQLIQDADLAGLFNTHNSHVYTTYVHLGGESEVYGMVFGGGMGQYDTVGESAGRVTGQTDVALDGATVWNEIYGGGQMADVRGNTLVHFIKGKAGHNAFGGGLGVLTTTEDKGIVLPDNRQTVLASADIKLIPNNYDLIINDNQTSLDALKALDLNAPANWMSEKKTGESFVVFDGTENSYTHYEFKKARTVNRDGEGNPIMVDGKYYTETDQFDPENPEQLFSINHNIYGGGKTASKVEGKTFVHINYGMVNDEMLNFEHEGQKVWSMIYNSIANAQFCVFGGGYGYHTDILGDANVTMDVQGSGQYKYINEFTGWFANEGKTKYGWDTNEGDPEAIYNAADESTWSHGAPGRSCMDIVGGGYNGKVHGTTNVTVGGDVVLRKVYGGGYYSSVGNTNVTIKSGIFNRVYGGGLIGNVYGKANLTIGQQYNGANDTNIAAANLHLLVKDAIYGGNDVSGTVGTTKPVDHENLENHVHYNVYSPYDNGSDGYYGTSQTDYGVRMNIYGGLVLGDVYGAGNGNHTGYGNPNYMEFGHSQHPSENYRKVIVEGETEITADSYAHVYKYRPRTARVEMTLQGNAGADFKDDPQVDKVRIWGRTFGGGNSCNVGIWDGTADDTKEVYADDATSWHPGDNFQGGGTIEINVGSHVQFGNRNDSHETPNGLFMGSNGEHMITQHLDAEKARYYHQYYDMKARKYYPGFVVYKDDAVTPIKRTTGLKAFKAFINNILTWTNNVNLNIDENAEDVWMSNFVGGGYRGSMKAFAADPQNPTEEELAASFDYALPEGVTVGHSVVGGAFNAHIIYRVYATNYGNGTYKTDANGNYLYETEEPDQGVKSKAEAEAYDEEHGNPKGTTPYDYIKKLYDEDGNLEGYLRYNFDGGMLAHDSEMNATNTGSRIHQIHNPSSLTTADFTCDDGYIANKSKALVHLNLKNRLQPMVHEADPKAGTKLNVHGGIVYGGCYLTGYVEGDSWVDYDCSLSPLCEDARFFSKENQNIYDEVADLDRNNALNVFGAGYGVDTHSMGDVYLCIKSIGTPGGGENGNYPFIYNVFGGSNMGTVAGSTNVYYDGGKQGTMLGSLYGGGYKGDIGGNTYVELVQGFLVNVYGGSRQANIGGAAHVWAYDGSTRPSTGIADDKYNHLIICNMYGGNDISGTISGTMEATWTKTTWSTLDGVGLNSYIQVSGTNPGTKGFPLVGNIYGGGNGDYDYESHKDSEGNETNPYFGLDIPNVGTSLLEIDGGTTLSAFGGGNKATITNDAYIFVNATKNYFADVTFTDYQKEILKNKFFKGVLAGYSWNGDELKMSEHHVDNIFGGNNVATMTIQPKWNLKSGKIGNVYSGGNKGDMTYYNALAGTAGHDSETKGLSITINSDDINIESLYGGCRMSDVKATLYEKDGEGNITETPQKFGNNEYGATVNVIKGHIGNVYGGNDISGYVYNGTNVNLSGSITGNVYGAGNGNYLYAYDRTGEHVTSGIAEVWNDDVNQYVYWIPSAEGDSQLKQLVSLTNARPHVSKAYLNINGEDEDNKVYIFGSVYCGGNASTIRPTGQETGDAHVKFNIGDNVIVNEVFMGSNGASLKYDANGKSTYLTDFEKVNDLDFSYDMTDADWTELLTMNGLDESKRDLIKNIYPNLLSVYMSAVDMKAMPLGFTEFSGHTFQNTWIGTFCMGGNAGSMMTDQPVDIVFPQSLKFFGRIIGGCKDASFQYKGKWHRGGFRMPLAAGATLKDDNDVAQPTKAKLRMKIRGDWYSRRMVMDKDDTYKADDYLAPDKTDDGISWNPTGKAWHDGCNVYGGCYQSGDMVGDVQIYIESDMLAYSRYLSNTPGATIDDYKEPSLEKSNELNIPVANVYGAGYGPESRSFGDAYIYMKDIPNVASHHPSVNNIFGGGRNGMLVGNSVIHVHDGLVFKDVVGGSFAAPMYGSSQVTVGYPKFYVCKKTGEYFLDRADKWNEGYMTKGNNKTESVIKNSIKYFEGTYVPCNVYNQITGVKVSNNNTLGALTSIRDYLETNKEKTNDYFEFHDEGADASIFPQGGWNNVEIRVRGGVYGGGFSLSNSTAAMAGSYTTLANTETYNQGTDSQGNSSVGYGGNSSIIITDQGSTKDHIKISTENPVVDNVYSGTGGIYGDGRLVFCEGFRAAELNGYGYAEHTPSNPLMLNSVQRLDLLTVNDCCFKLYGDEDFATDEINKRKYSLARIGELRMNSTINATGTYATGNLTTAQSRNYIGFYNDIHYLGSIVTNDDFHNGKFHDAEGVVDNTNTYRSKKQWYIDQYHGKDDQTSVSTFKQRNYATARNMVGINSGFCLRVENQYYEGDEHATYYGPIVGVAEVKLLNVQPGEGGGYVYADNIHADVYESGHSTSDATFMNESGNFVFEGVVRPDESETQYIVDDCLPTGFDDWKKGRAVASELPEQHYWYVIGDTYYYNSTLTAFSFNGKKEFNLTNSDPNIIFAGIEDGSEVSLQSVKWQPVTYPEGYTGDIRGGRDSDLTPLEGSDVKYRFDVQVGDKTSWSEEMPRSTSDDPTEAMTSPATWTAYGNTSTTPRFNVHLLDNVNNCPNGEEETYFNSHLSVPERVKLIIKSRKKDGEVDGVSTYETKTYNVTLEIVYIQGPSFTGNVNLLNCALPGEHIGFNSKDIKIKTTEQLPVTGYGWKLVPLVSEITDNETGKTTYTWQDEKNGIDIPASYYSTNAEGYLEGSIPALYSQNHWNVIYTFNAGGETFTVAPTTDEHAALNERMLVVHNYHKMADIVDTKYDVSLSKTDGNIYAKALKPGAMIYLADDADIAAFVNYVNDGNTTEGMHFYLLNDLTLPDIPDASTSVIIRTFAGTLHGNGYSLVFNGSPVEPTPSLFGDNLTGKVYNLGVPNGSITTVPAPTTVPDASASVINCFTAADGEDNLRYGKTAYALSHYYTTDNDESQRDGYVHSLYVNNDNMGGDWRYARTSNAGTRYLRTTAPNYGFAQTSHNISHAGNYELTRHDCLFFGQELTPTAEKKYPVHIDDEKITESNWRENNRVYRTTGYYRSTTVDKYHYNKVAWAMQPTLTAIDFTAENPEVATVPDDSPLGSFYGKTDDRPASLTSFSSDHNGTVTPYSNATNSKVTQNLLVYNNGETAFNHRYLSGTSEDIVQYQNIVKSDAYKIENLHLVDKQDFCAPIEFNVTNRAWYERNPANYAESNNDAWEGICLPFTATKITLSEGITRHQDTGGNAMIYALNNESQYALRPVVEGETQQDITFFWGTPTEEMLANPKINDRTLNHEFWLRSLNAVDKSKNPVEATFLRPDTYAFNGNTPYIVSFPGERYHEFDLTDQTITFSNGAVTIPVTDNIFTTANDYNHVGTFLHRDDVEYGMNDDGTGFTVEKNAVLPFRTYMTQNNSLSKQQLAKQIIIGSLGASQQETIGDEEQDDPEDGITGECLRIRPNGNRIIIESTYPVTLMVYTINGSIVRALDVRPGINTYSGIPSGIYIVGKTKIHIM